MKSQFRQTSKRIYNEVNQVFKEKDEQQNDLFMEDVLSKDRIFIAGVGRTGLMMKSFSMRLKHLGLKVFYIGETNTPSVNHKELLIVGSGSGETLSLDSITEKAKNLGVKIVLFTKDELSTLAKQASRNIKISAPSPKLQKSNNLDSIQPMGSLFEQSLLITLETHCGFVDGKIGPPF
jgi:Predicted sugar phosphate isomerase involved in capsule formation